MMLRQHAIEDCIVSRFFSRLFSRLRFAALYSIRVAKRRSRARKLLSRLIAFVFSKFGSATTTRDHGEHDSRERRETVVG